MVATQKQVTKKFIALRVFPMGIHSGRIPR
jgi:hypothetical protein